MQIFPPTCGKNWVGVLKNTNSNLLRYKNWTFLLNELTIEKNQINMMMQQILWVSISIRIESATFVNLLVEAFFSKTNISNPSQLSKLPINDVLTKNDFCAFLGMPYKTLEDCIFYQRYDAGAFPSYFNIFRSEGKDDLFNSLPKSPTFAKGLV